MAQLAGFQGQVLITQTPNVAISNQLLQDSGDHTTFTVKVVDAAKRYWDDTTAFVFQTSPDGTTWTTVAPASVKYVGGSVTFPAAVTGATPSARVSSGAYWPYSTMLEVTDWKFSGQRLMKDVTSMKGPGSTDRSKAFIPLQLTGNMSLNKWWQTELAEVTGFLNLITTGARTVLSLVTPANNRYEGYVFMKTGATHIPVADVVDRALQFQITGNFYGN